MCYKNTTSSRASNTLSGRAAAALARRRMGVVVRGPVGMGMRLDQHIGRHQYDPAMPHAALGNHVLAEMLHLVGLPAQDCDLHAAVMVERRMHGCDRQFMVVVEGVGQTL